MLLVTLYKKNRAQRRETPLSKWMEAWFASIHLDGHGDVSILDGGVPERAQRNSRVPRLRARFFFFNNIFSFCLNVGFLLVFSLSLPHVIFLS